MYEPALSAQSFGLCCVFLSGSRVQYGVFIGAATFKPQVLSLCNSSETRFKNKQCMENTPIRHILAQKKTKKTFTLLTKVSIMVSLPPDERVTKGSGDVNNDKPHEILHRQVPAQNTTVSFPTAQPVHRKNKALMVFAHCNHAPPTVKLCYTSEWERRMT